MTVSAPGRGRPKKGRPPEYTDIELAAIASAARAPRLPPPMGERETAVSALRVAWSIAAKKVIGIRERYHLTDATTSPGDFESLRRLAVTMVDALLSELEAAGCLSVKPDRQLALNVLEGGRE